MKQVEKQIDNIVVAISNGYIQSEFMNKLDELRDQKIQLETQLKEVITEKAVSIITTDQIKKMFLTFRDFVKERNLPECKKFIQNYVNKVIVHKDHVEVIFNVVLNFWGCDGYQFKKSSVSKKILFAEYEGSKRLRDRIQLIS